MDWEKADKKMSKLCTACESKMKLFRKGELSKAPQVCKRCQEIMQNKMMESRYAGREE